MFHIYLIKQVPYPLSSHHRVHRDANGQGLSHSTASGRVGYRDPETGKHYIFLTNNFNLAAKTIADIDKARWQVELFFKWIKQNLKIKSFLGTSKNAVMTQIWIALCVYLLLSFIKFQAKLKRSLQQILRVLHLNLFEKRDLMASLRGDALHDGRAAINQMALL